MAETSQTLTPNAQLLLDAFNASPIGITIENLDGQPLFVNPAFCSMLGFTEQELQGKHRVQFSPSEDAEKDWALFQQLRAGSIDHYQLEKRYFRGDGSLVWGYLSISLLKIPPSPLVIAMLEPISGMSRKLIESQEQERARIGRELRDDINQRLAMLAVEIDQLQDNPSEIKSRVQELRKQTIGIWNDVLALSHELHASKLEYLGAIKGMKSWCKEFGERQGIQIEFKSAEVQSSVTPEIGLCLFRVLQEALHNASKGSGAGRVDVQLWEDSADIHLVISASGRGFDSEAAMRGRGFDLVSMRERVRLVNGTIAVESMLKGGAAIHVRIPPEPVQISERAVG